MTQYKVVPSFLPSAVSGEIWLRRSRSAVGGSEAAAVSQSVSGGRAVNLVPHLLTFLCQTALFC